MTSAELVIAFIETYVTVPEGRAVGEPMRLMDWQKAWLVEVFDNPHGTRRAILSMGRKNAKTTLIAALLLAYVVGPLAVRNAQVYSAALSREQASLTFALMAKMTRQSADLSANIVIRDSQREMLCTLTGVRYRALSADASTAMGTSPIAFVFDEAGQVVGPHCALFDALHSGQGAHQAPIEFVISTQAASDADFLSLLIDDARRGGDPKTVCKVFEAPADCDVTDEAAWRAANPALGTIIAVDYVRTLAEEASRLPSREAAFRNLLLNQRIEGASPFVTRAVWMRNAAEPAPLGPKVKVWAGLDLSMIADLTALIAVYRTGTDLVWNALAHFWTPAEGIADRARRDHAAYVEWARAGHLHKTPGATVDYDVVAKELLDLASECDLQAVAFDRWRIEHFKAALVRVGATEALLAKLRPFGQGYQSMSPAIEALEGELLNNRIAHGDHPVLTMCAANARVDMDAAGNRKLDKTRTTGRIDGMVALTMAIGAAKADATDEKPKEYQMFFLGGR